MPRELYIGTELSLVTTNAFRLDSVKLIASRFIVPLLLLIIPMVVCSAFCAEPPLTGPATEKRFPPLKLPAGFKATLFACDPLIEYPSVIALGPRPGTVFVAHDYMTGLGFDIVWRDEVRCVAE